MNGAWDVEFHAQFVPEFEALAAAVQDELLAHVAVLEAFGPQLGRPRADSLYGSRHANMKSCDSMQRTASGGLRSPSTPKRRAIVLCGGDKSGRPRRVCPQDVCDRALG